MAARFHRPLKLVALNANVTTALYTRIEHMKLRKEECIEMVPALT
jgi:hypothetical protein